MVENVYSLRQHDLDQVIRVERGTLLSVPHRGTPRSIVECKYTRNFQIVNLKTVGLHGCSKVQIFSTPIAQIGEWREENLKIREIRCVAPFAL